jgi:hypothetical protein
VTRMIAVPVLRERGIMWRPAYQRWSHLLGLWLILRILDPCWFLLHFNAFGSWFVSFAADQDLHVALGVKGLVGYFWVSSWRRLSFAWLWLVQKHRCSFNEDFVEVLVLWRLQKVHSSDLLLSSESSCLLRLFDA